MTNFIKSKFHMSSGSEIWVTYLTDTERKFVARFKYMKPKTNANAFVKFLIANFTVEEYFEALESIPPLTILQQKGYVSPNMKTAMMERSI